jgi:hypothetical protein
MASKFPEGLFVQVNNFPSDDEVREWFNRIEDHRRLGFQYYMTVLTLQNIATKDANGQIVLSEHNLDLIKDYLPNFTFVFVGSVTLREPDGTWDPFRDGIKEDNFRWENIYATRDAATKFIQWMKNRHMNIKIHWYINYEADLNYFTALDGISIKDAYKWYIMQLTSDLTDISLQNGLNEPEFFWSPLFGKPYASLSPFQRSRLISGIKDILDSVPRLGWLHFQDGVGGFSIKHQDGTITYGRKPQEVIDYYQKILVAASGGNLRSGLINMEYFVFDENRNIYSGDPAEHEDRLCKYREAGIPVGVSWEVRWWYKSLYGD